MKHLTPLQAIKRQITLQESINRKDCWNASHLKTIEEDNLFAEIIALQYLSFNFVEGIGFYRLTYAVLPRYKLRGKEHFSKIVCQTLFEQVANIIKYMLESYTKLSFTSDIWSDPSVDVSLLSLTAHSISENFTKTNFILKCEIVEGSHTGD